MVQEHNGHSSNSNLIRVHEEWIKQNRDDIKTLSKNVNRIPWILLLAAINIILSLVALLSKGVHLSGAAIH